MPLTETQKAIAYATLPGVVGFIAGIPIMNDSAYTDWWKNLKRPSWATHENELRFHLFADLLTFAPLAYATVQVFKKGGFDNVDSGRALAAYAVNASMGFVCTPMFKRKCLKGAFFGVAAVFANSCAISYLYYQVDKQAGYLTLPYTLLCACNAFYVYNLWQFNKK